MSRGSLLAVLAVGVGAPALTTSAPARPPAALLQAVAKTSAAKSASIAFTEEVVLGGTTVTIKLHGIEDPQTGEASAVFTITPDTSHLGRADEILQGSSVYVHFATLDRLHAKYPAVKSWMVVNASSTLGVDPTSLAILSTAELRATSGFKQVGTGTDGGVQVTDYSGTLALRRAAQEPAMQQLMARLPSIADFLAGHEKVVFAVGSDGYLHRVTGTMTVPVRGGGSIDVHLDFRLSGFNASNGAIVPPPGAEVMTQEQFDKALGLPVASADADAIGKVSLPASDVGAGYVLSQIPGGQLVQGETTLDFCGLSYQSEALRTARIQTVYTKKGSKFSASNEVVSYQSGGAATALAEVRKASRVCPTGRIAKAPLGVTHYLRRIKVLHDSKLLPGSVVILETDSGIVKGKHRKIYSVEVFQVRGNVLSGVYGTGPTAAATESGTLHAAEQSAARMANYVPVAKAKHKAGGGLPVA